MHIAQSSQRGMTVADFVDWPGEGSGRTVQLIEGRSGVSQILVRSYRDEDARLSKHCGGGGPQR